MATVFDMCTDEVRKFGYYHGIIEILQERAQTILYSERSHSFFANILIEIEKEVNKIPKGARLPGCSEVIESVFGKFKQLEKNHASGGLTSLVLSLPAIVGEVSMDIVKQAMEA